MAGGNKDEEADQSKVNKGVGKAGAAVATEGASLTSDPNAVKDIAEGAQEVAKDPSSLQKVDIKEAGMAGAQSMSGGAGGMPGMDGGGGMPGMDGGGGMPGMDGAPTGGGSASPAPKPKPGGPPGIDKMGADLAEKSESAPSTQGNQAQQSLAAAPGDDMQQGAQAAAQVAGQAMQTVIGIVKQGAAAVGLGSGKDLTEGPIPTNPSAAQNFGGGGGGGGAGGPSPSPAPEAPKPSMKPGGGSSPV